MTTIAIQTPAPVQASTVATPAATAPVVVFHDSVTAGEAEALSRTIGIAREFASAVQLTSDKTASKIREQLREAMSPIHFTQRAMAYMLISDRIKTLVATGFVEETNRASGNKMTLENIKIAKGALCMASNAALALHDEAMDVGFFESSTPKRTQTRTKLYHLLVRVEEKKTLLEVADRLADRMSDQLKPALDMMNTSVSLLANVFDENARLNREKMDAYHAEGEQDRTVLAETIQRLSDRLESLEATATKPKATSKGKNKNESTPRA